MTMSVSSPHPDPLPEGEGTLQVTEGMRHPILFYDGVCALCNRVVQFVLRHDPAGRFRFAPLQSELARRVLERHHRDARDVDTMSLLVDAGTPREQLLSKSDGVLAVLDELGGAWKLLTLARVLPRALRDRGYDVIVRHRYRWFGRYDQCPIPPPGVRQRFID
jgi:predicted DCC family thiol-disulfide oxidoreductase YuxK